MAKKVFVSAMVLVASCLTAWGQTGYNVTYTNENSFQNMATITKSENSNKTLVDAISEVNEKQINNADIKKVKIVGDITSDASALSAITCTTIDLSEATFTSFTNNNVKYVVLPNGWTKEQVNTTAKAIGNSSFIKFFFGDQGVSPRKIDNLFYGYGGSVATTLASIGGMLYDGSFGNGIRVDTDLTSMPMLSGITSDLMKNPKTVTKYYEQFDKQSKYNAEFKQTNKKPAGYDPVLYAKMSKAKNYLSGLNRKERAILMDKSISVSEMKQKQKDIQEKRVYAMKKILGD